MRSVSSWKEGTAAAAGGNANQGGNKWMKLEEEVELVVEVKEEERVEKKEKKVTVKEDVKVVVEDTRKVQDIVKMVEDMMNNNLASLASGGRAPRPTTKDLGL